MTPTESSGIHRPALCRRDVLSFDKLDGGSDTATTMLRNIGFLHLVSNYQFDPIGALRVCLRQASRGENLTDCLIVTPEALNIPNGYFNHSPPFPLPDLSIAGSLEEISIDFQVALVAGLIDEGIGGRRGYSSAYLIDGHERELLSRKMKEDTSRCYEPCPYNCDKPVLHRGLCVAALLCRDAAEFNHDQPSERHRTLLERISALKAEHAVLCVPARMAEYNSELVAKDWPRHLNVVVANAGSSYPSVIRPAGGRADTGLIRFKGERNEVHVVALG